MVMMDSTFTNMVLFGASLVRDHRWANHFHPESPIFTKKEGKEVLISDCGKWVWAADFNQEYKGLHDPQ
jgi:hypothetical protein